MSESISDKTAAVRLIPRNEDNPLVIASAVTGPEWTYCAETGQVCQNGLSRRPADMVKAANRALPRAYHIRYPGV